MNSRVMAGLLLSSSLFAAACGGTKIQMDDVNGNNADGAQNAIFFDDVQPTDLDGDGTDDADITALEVILSDQADLCTSFGDPNFDITQVADIQAVSVFALRVDALGAGGFNAGDALTSNKALLDLFFGAPAVGDTIVDATVSVRQGGTDIINAGSDITKANDGSIDLNKFTSQTEVAIDFSMTLEQDSADPATFNTDLDGDGANDVEAITAALGVKVKSATFCAALGQ